MASSFQNFPFLITLLFLSIIIFFFFLIVKNRAGNADDRFSVSLRKKLEVKEEEESNNLRGRNGKHPYHVTDGGDDIDSIISNKKKTVQTIEDWQDDEDSMGDRLRKAREIVDTHLN